MSVAVQRHLFVWTRMGRAQTLCVDISVRSSFLLFESAL